MRWPSFSQRVDQNGPATRRLIPTLEYSKFGMRARSDEAERRRNSLWRRSRNAGGASACAGAADLYDGRHTLAREIVRPDLPVTRRYKDLLDNKDIDCIVAAVPDHWHRQVVIDAVSAGKDIYCEKPMSHSPADGVAMVDA